MPISAWCRYRSLIPGLSSPPVASGEPRRRLYRLRVPEFIIWGMSVSYGLASDRSPWELIFSVYINPSWGVSCTRISCGREDASEVQERLSRCKPAGQEDLCRYEPADFAGFTGQCAPCDSRRQIARPSQAKARSSSWDDPKKTTQRQGFKTNDSSSIQPTGSGRSSPSRSRRWRAPSWSSSSSISSRTR